MTNFLAFSSVEQPQRGLNGFLPLPFTAYTVSSLADETRATDAWVVDGDLPSPKVFSLPDLKAMTREKVKRPIRSVDGWHSTHTWGGVWLATLMQTL
ncbi:MAG: hypothetical protein U0003_06055, partial [Vampirovibrionales bacterium]